MHIQNKSIKLENMIKIIGGTLVEHLKSEFIVYKITKNYCNIFANKYIEKKDVNCKGKLQECIKKLTLIYMECKWF